MLDYKNKFFSILGDSLSALEGYSEPPNSAFYEGGTKFLAGVVKPENTWWGMVINALGAELLVNNSIAGSTVCRHPLCEFPTYACSEERTGALSKMDINPDVIMVLLGYNDWGCGLKIYNDADKKGNDLTVFSVAYNLMLSNLKRNYPAAEIWCFTLPVTKCTRIENFKFPYCYAGRHISEYNDYIRIAAKEFGARLIDLNRACPPCDTVDRFHPTEEGMKIIATATLSELGVL